MLFKEVNLIYTLKRGDCRLKEKSSVRDVDSYIASFPDEVQAILENLRKIIKAAAPDAEEAMAYGMPTFRINGKNLVHFAAFKSHIGFYPTPSGIDAFEKELTHYKHSKGAIQFPIDDSIPFGLVEKIVNFRLRENE